MTNLIDFMRKGRVTMTTAVVERDERLPAERPREPLPVPLRSRPARRFSWRWARRLLGPLVLLAIWQVGAWTGLIPARSLAPPGQVGSAAWDLIRTGELQHHLWVSLGRAVK